MKFQLALKEVCQNIEGAKEPFRVNEELKLLWKTHQFTAVAWESKRGLVRAEEADGNAHTLCASSPVAAKDSSHATEKPSPVSGLCVEWLPIPFEEDLFGHSTMRKNYRRTITLFNAFEGSPASL